MVMIRIIIILLHTYVLMIFNKICTLIYILRGHQNITSKRKAKNKNFIPNENHLVFGANKAFLYRGLNK